MHTFISSPPSLPSILKSIVRVFFFFFLNAIMINLLRSTMNLKALSKSKAPRETEREREGGGLFGLLPAMNTSIGCVNDVHLGAGKDLEEAMGTISRMADLSYLPVEETSTMTWLDVILRSTLDLRPPSCACMYVCMYVVSSWVSKPLARLEA